MRRNVSGQYVGAQMVSASDGSAFTGTVSVLVTVDNGTQTAGGGSAPSHEGNGYHSYGPTQAETNGSHVAFTFTGTGAIPVTVQIYPVAYDSSGRFGIDWSNIGAPTTTVNLSGTTVKTATDVETDTADIQSRLPAALVSGRIDASVGAMAANVLTASALATDAVNEIADGVWDEALSGHLSAGSTGEALNAAGAAGDPWTTTLPGAYGAGSAGYIVGNNLNAPVGTVDTVVDAIKAVTDNLPDSGALTTITNNVAAILADTGTDGVVVAAGSKTGYSLSATQTFDLTGNITGNLSGSVGSLTTNNDKTGYTLSATGSAAMTEGYAALGAAGTLPQILYEIRALLAEKSISSTTLTTKKLDGTTTAATYTLDDATTPSAITRAT